MSIWTLIAIPALITLGITIVRLAGELEHWPSPWFSNAAGGGAAIVGISWLPIIFGPYFAVKLMRAGSGPGSMGKAAGFMVLGVVVFILCAAGIAYGMSHSRALALGCFVVALIAAFIPRIGWRSFGSVLIAYAFAARVPVLIVMFFAMRGNGGAGWGTHYDAIAPAFAHLSFGAKFLDLAVLPQMFMWIGYTVVLSSLIGIIVCAAARPKRRTVAEPA